MDQRHKDTILVGGDDADNFAKLVLHLQVAKFKVFPVNNRDSIVTLSRSEVPSLILLDLKSCFDICRMLKRNFVTEPIPIIALLFPAEEVDRVAVLELGADDCLAKPFSFRELTLRIRCSLNRARDKQGKARHKQSITMSTQSDRHHFMSIAGLPGRLTTQEAAWLLGFSEHDIPVLVSHRMLKPLGAPPPNGGRYYSFNELETFRHDTKWLDKASAVIVKHWKTQNADRRSDAPAGFMNRIRSSKRKNSDSSESRM